MSFVRRTSVRRGLFALAALAGVLAAAPASDRIVSVTPILPKQRLPDLPRDPLVPGSARDLEFKKAGVNLFAPGGSAQVMRLWQSSSGTAGAAAVVRHRLTIAHPEAADGRAHAVAFVASHAAVLFAGGRASGFNVLAKRRFAELGFQPSFGNGGFGVPSSNDPRETVANRTPPAPIVQGVTVNGVPNGMFTGAPDDAVLVTGSGLALLDRANGFVNGPTTLHVALGNCAGFDAIVQAVDPDGRWVEAVAGPGAQHAVVDRRVQPGLLRLATAGGPAAPQAVSYAAQLEVDTFTIPVDLKDDRAALPANPLGITRANSSFTGARESTSARSSGAGRDVVGKGILPINGAAYLGATATPNSQVAIAWPMPGLFGIQNSAAVVSRANGFDLTTVVDWRFAPASAIAYTLAVEIEAPIGVRSVSTMPSTGGACGT